MFQTIGHPDLPKKFGPRPTRDCTGLHRDLFAACEATGTCIELNTAGLRKDCAEIYPNLKFLKLAKSAHVQITFGSDAHATHEVGMNLEDAVTLAREAGYDQCCRFTGCEKTVVVM